MALGSFWIHGFGVVASRLCVWQAKMCRREGPRADVRISLLACAHGYCSPTSRLTLSSLTRSANLRFRFTSADFASPPTESGSCAAAREIEATFRTKFAKSAQPGAQQGDDGGDDGLDDESKGKGKGKSKDKGEGGERDSDGAPPAKRRRLEYSSSSGGPMPSGAGLYDRLLAAGLAEVRFGEIGGFCGC